MCSEDVKVVPCVKRMRYALVSSLDSRFVQLRTEYGTTGTRTARSMVRKGQHGTTVWDGKVFPIFGSLGQPSPVLTACGRTEVERMSCDLEESKQCSNRMKI